MCPPPPPPCQNLHSNRPATGFVCASACGNVWNIGGSLLWEATSGLSLVLSSPHRGLLSRAGVLSLSETHLAATLLPTFPRLAILLPHRASSPGMRTVWFMSRAAYPPSCPGPTPGASTVARVLCRQHACLAYVSHAPPCSVGQGCNLPDPYVTLLLEESVTEIPCCLEASTAFVPSLLRSAGEGEDRLRPGLG